IAGILFDAGKNGSQRLMQVGMPGVQTGSADNPIVLSDLFFRVGGNGPAAAKICLEVNSNYVIGDDFWLWRADHGAGAGWYSNPADTGLVVNGDNMTMYCLMCEHFQKYETLWNGNGGKMYFFQNEFPYDVVKQSEWMSHDGTVNGYSAYKVADNVTSHEAWGLGCYNVFINVEEYIDVHSAIEVPDANGVKVHNACTLCLTGGKMPKGSITHIINEVGDSVGSKTGFARKYVIEY
ncbi:MAG: sialidase, partial [Firmicutes bacterium]|nr:sialidase [Bacillota bacterium]